MRSPRMAVLVLAGVLVAGGPAACGDGHRATPSFVDGSHNSAPSGTSAPGTPSPAPPSSAPPSPRPAPRKAALPRTGNPAGHATVPADGRAVDTSRPDHVIGHGTPASCTSAGVVKAVAAGGIITFDCGAAPVTITMTATAKVRNRNGSRVV